MVNDILGLGEEFSPRFVKVYAEIGKQMTRAFDEYVEDVKHGRFPDLEHSYSSGKE